MRTGSLGGGKNYRGIPNVLKLYKPLEGFTYEGFEVLEIFKEGSIIKALVESKVDITGLFLSPRITGTLDNKEVISVDYEKTRLEDLFLTKNYSVKGLDGFTKV